MIDRIFKASFFQKVTVHHIRNYRIVELLIKRTSADIINKPDNNHCYPLTMAAWGGHEKAVEVLLRHPDIDLHARDMGWGTALDWARKEGYQGIIKLLEDKMGG